MTKDNDPNVIIVPLSPEQLAEREAWAAKRYEREFDAVSELRRQAYQAESDPIFFQWQRGETYTQEDWQAKVEEINARYPYPEK